MKFWAKSAFAILPALLLLGCGTSGEVKEGMGGAEGQATQPAAGMEEGGATAQGAGSEGEMAGEHMGGEVIVEGVEQLNPLDDPNSLLATRVIYFDFDKSEVRPEFRDVINAHAEYLAAHPDVHVTIEGHADERGTREYNMALGERRANAVKRLMVLQGVADDQLRIISYGEERPVALGHNEEAWALNRRAVIDYER